MRVARVLSFATPLVLFVGLGAPSAYWFDSGEFIASASSLSVSHPPGHPLYALTAKLLTFLPLGSIAFRVSLASALCATGCALVLFGLARSIVRQATDGLGEGAASALALACALGVGLSSSLGLQAVRAEVYALQALVTLGGLACATRAVGSGDPRHLVAAGLLAGLSLANNHFLGLIALPGLAAGVALLHGQRARTGVRAPFAAMGAALGLGLTTYLFLPLRAGALQSLGAPDNVRDFFWVVSAEVYQKTAYTAPEPWGARIADVITLLATDLAGVGLLAGIGGVWVMARVPRLRSSGWIWAPAAVLYPLARAWLGFIRDNPDAAGYVVPGLAALALCAVAFASVALGMVPPARQHLVRIALGVTVGMAIVMGPGRADRYSLAHFWGGEDLVRASTSDLGPRGVVIVTHFETAFILAAERATSNERPDVTVMALPFLGYPGYAGALVRRDRSLAGVVRATLLDGSLSETELSSLASTRPTLVELDVGLPRSVDEYLSPLGPFAIARGEPVALEDLQASAPAHRARWASVMSRLGPWAREDRQTRAVLLWHRYLEALLYAARGERELSNEAAEAAEGAIPGTPELRDLRLALRTGQGPLDVTPFLPRTP